MKQNQQFTSYRFWKAVDPRVKRSLHLGQIAEIERALERTYPQGKYYTDLRFRLGSQFVVFLWGKERRSAARLAEDGKQYSLFTAKNLPFVGALFGIIISFLYVGIQLTAPLLQ